MRAYRSAAAVLSAVMLCSVGWTAGGLRAEAASVGSVLSAVRFPLSRFRLGVALGGSRVGANAPLLDIARKAGAACAINGGFFAAYPGETGEPYGTLVINGKLLHLGGVGTRLDVADDGAVQFAPDHLQIRGSLDGSEVYPYNWYAYNLNQTPSPGVSGAFIYTPERGITVGFRADLAIIARGGWVIGLAQGTDVAIPRDGFVLALQRQEVAVLGWKFRVGQRIDYRAVQDGLPFAARFSLGAGPRLVRSGAVAADPVAEGFRDPKILSFRGQRSVVGLDAAHEIILAVIGNATVGEAGIVMRMLGATDAMNLDDNGSSGLVCNGQYLVWPGRQLADALVLWPDLASR